jgi:uncharacterized protein
MSDSGGPRVFDDTARASIRRRLLCYMAEHRIGVIRLADRISKANRRNPEIPIKTLQRFIAGNFRTSDMYVGFFQQFTENLPEPDPIGELGKAMAAFLNAKDSDVYQGSFLSRISAGNGTNSVSYQSQITIAADQNFCRVVERSTEGRLIVCDGILVAQGRTAVVSLQDRTTKAPRQYLIASKDDAYAATGTEAVFKPDSDYVVRALSGWITPSERVRAAEYMGKVSEAEWVRSTQQRSRRSGVPMPRRRRLLEKLTETFRRTPVMQPPEETAAQSVSDPDDGSFSVSDQFREVGETEEPMRRDQPQAAFLIAAEKGDKRELRRLVGSGVDINEPDPATGLTALHLSVGRNAIGLVRFLVERGAAFVPDNLGRMPSTIAAESEVSEELCDYIVEAEARAEGV